MPSVGPSMWMTIGLVLLGFAVYSYAQAWNNGKMWQVLGGIGVASVLYGWYGRGKSTAEVIPGAVAGYKTANPAGIQVPRAAAGPTMPLPTAPTAPRAQSPPSSPE